MRNLALLALTTFAACGDDTTTPPDAPVTPDTPVTPVCEVTPGAWSAPDFVTNAAEALALRGRIDTLTGVPLMRGAEQGTVLLPNGVADLEAVYNGGAPFVLSAHVHAAADTVMTDVFAEFVASIGAGQVDLTDASGAWTPGAAGGIFGTRLAAFNIGGIETRQIVDKALFAGGSLYPYALDQTTGTITEATIDRLAAAWGSNATLDPVERTDSANYSFAMGFHAAIAEHLTNAKAYAASPDCTAERDEAIVAFFRAWEHSMFARAVFYANDGETKLAAAANDNQISDALHNFAEGIGLAIGFRGMPHPATGPLANAGRIVTDADIDAMLTPVGINVLDSAASTVGNFVTDNTQFRPGVTLFENRVKTVFSVDDAAIITYRTPSEG